MARLNFSPSPIVMAVKVKWRICSKFTVVNKALLTTVNFEQILHLTLTAITIGEGLKFNRAMLFLVNEKDHVLEGTMAIGPDSAEEAGKVWNSLSQRKGPLSDLIHQLP